MALTVSEKREIAQQKKRIAEYRGKIRDELENGQRVKARFHNAEQPGVPLEFTYEGIFLTKKEPDDGITDEKDQGGKNKPAPFLFEEGKTYNIPVIIYDHVVNLTVPDDKFIEDEATGQTKSVPGIKNRFNFVVDAKDIAKPRKAKDELDSGEDKGKGAGIDGKVNNKRPV